MIIIMDEGYVSMYVERETPNQCNQWALFYFPSSRRSLGGLPVLIHTHMSIFLSCDHRQGILCFKQQSGVVALSSGLKVVTPSRTRVEPKAGGNFKVLSVISFMIFPDCACCTVAPSCFVMGCRKRILYTYPAANFPTPS